MGIGMLRAALVALGVLVLVVAAAAEEGVRVPDSPVVRYTLSNGLRVILQVDRRQPRVAVAMAYGVGSRDDPPGYAGLAHLMEHLAFRGSRHVPPFACHTLLRRVGGTNVQAVTSSDSTVYSATVPSTRLELALWIESDRMGFLLEHLNQEDLELERDIIVDEMRRGGGSGLLQGHVGAMAYPPGHPYLPARDRYADLNAIELEHVQSQLQRGYRPDNAWLVLVGDLDVEATQRLVQKYFGPIQNPPVRLSRAARGAVQFTGARHVTIGQPFEREAVLMLWPAPTSGDPDEPVLEVLTRLLGRGRVSRLHQNVVDRLHLATEAHAGYGRVDLAGWISVVAAVGHQQDVGRLEAALDDVIQELQSRSVSSAELKSVQRGAVTDFIEEHESISRRAARLAHLAERGVPLVSPRDTIRKIRAVTAADVRRVARKYLRADRRLVVRFVERADLPARGEILESRGSLFPPRRPKP